MKFLVTTILFFLPFTSYATNDSKLQKEAFIQVNQQGIDLAATIVKQEVLKDIKNQILPPIKERSNGVDVEIPKSILNVEFGTVRLKLINNRVQAFIYIKKAQVYASHIKFRKKVLGATLKSTCRDTTVKVKPSSPLAVTGLVELVALPNGKLKMQTSNISFGIPSSAYDVTGPRKCSGDLGIGSLIRTILKKTLKKHKGEIEKLVRNQAYRTAASFQNEINKQIPFQVPLSLPSNEFFSNAEINLTAKLNKITVRPQSIHIDLDLDLNKKTSKDVLLNSEPKIASASKIVAKMGLHLDFLNHTLREIHQSFQKDFELEARDIRKVLNTTSTSSIWPDLNEITLEKTYLRAFVGMAEAPIINASNTGTFNLNIPGLEMTFKAFKNELQWFDYSRLTIDLSADLLLNEDEDSYRADLLEVDLSQIEGSWPFSYVPTFELVDVESAEILFFSLAEYLNAENQSFEFNLDLDLLNQYGLSAANLRVNSGRYLEFSLFKD